MALVAPMVAEALQAQSPNAVLFVVSTCLRNLISPPGLAAPPPRRRVLPPNAKLTPFEVMAIRGRNSMGETQTALAKEYGVARETIWAICHGKSWKHLLPKGTQ